MGAEIRLEGNTAIIKGGKLLTAARGHCPDLRAIGDFGAGRLWYADGRTANRRI